VTIVLFGTAVGVRDRAWFRLRKKWRPRRGPLSCARDRGGDLRLELARELATSGAEPVHVP
jgi:hypothetical protein